MLGRQSPQNMLDSYRKKKPLLPVILAVMATLLIIIGAVIIVLWITGGGLNFNLFSKEPTPTSTMPPTPVMSATPTFIPTESPTPTATISPTPSGPFEYEVKEADTCYDIALRFEVDLETLLAINNFEDGTCPIIPGQVIKVPSPDQTLPTPSPVPADLSSGTEITYKVQTGDSLASIASKFNSTIEDILSKNTAKFEDEDENNLPIGLELVIRVNIVTPTPTFAPTSTLAS